jgi:hypothetical protein
MVPPSPAVSIVLNGGWNLIALPPGTAAGYTAQGLLDDVRAQGGRPVEIGRWQAAGWQSHADGLPGDDFPVEAGRAYFLLMSAGSMWRPH